MKVDKSKETIRINIDMEATGGNIKELIKNSSYTIKDIMRITGVTSEQAIYKWYRGASLPSVETLLTLCKLFNKNVEDVIVTCEGGDSQGYEELFRNINAKEQ